MIRRSFTDAGVGPITPVRPDIGFDVPLGRMRRGWLRRSIMFVRAACGLAACVIVAGTSLGQTPLPPTGINPDPTWRTGSAKPGGLPQSSGVKPGALPQSSDAPVPAKVVPPMTVAVDPPTAPSPRPQPSSDTPVAPKTLTPSTSDAAVTPKTMPPMTFTTDPTRAAMPPRCPARSLRVVPRRIAIRPLAARRHVALPGSFGRTSSGCTGSHRASISPAR